MFLRSGHCRYIASPLHRCCEIRRWCVQSVLLLLPPRWLINNLPARFLSKTCIVQASRRQVCRSSLRGKGVGGRFCPLWCFSVFVMKLACWMCICYSSRLIVCWPCKDENEAATPFAKHHLHNIQNYKNNCS